MKQKDIKINQSKSIYGKQKITTQKRKSEKARLSSIRHSLAEATLPSLTHVDINLEKHTNHNSS